MATDDLEAGLLTGEPRFTLELWDWRRQMATLYARVRSLPPEEGWRAWREGRDRLFREHPQSPLPRHLRSSFPGLPIFDYDPSLRVRAEVVRATDAAEIGLIHSGGGATRARAFGAAVFEIRGTAASLPIYRLLAYGDGIFLPFRDATNGDETYGGGRYLIDTVKGADTLESVIDGPVLDFNFAYHPSCVHDSSWSCPLAPAGSGLPMAIRGGERMAR